MTRVAPSPRPRPPPAGRGRPAGCGRRPGTPPPPWRARRRRARRATRGADGARAGSGPARPRAACRRARRPGRAGWRRPRRAPGGSCPPRRPARRRRAAAPPATPRAADRRRHPPSRAPPFDGRPRTAASLTTQLLRDGSAKSADPRAPARHDVVVRGDDLVVLDRGYRAKRAAGPGSAATACSTSCRPARSGRGGLADVLAGQLGVPAVRALGGLVRDVVSPNSP